jgi:hypothetical protein
MPSPAMPVKLVSSTDTAHGGLCKRGDFVDIVPWQEGVNFQPVPMLVSEYLGGGAIAGPVAWYRKGSGITVTGSGVSQWSDASGNARHLLQGTDTNRPALQSDGTILFDGADNFLATLAFTLNQPATYYIAMKQITWSSGEGFMDGTLTNTQAIFQTGVTPSISLYAGAAAAPNTDLTLDTYFAVAAVFNGASSVLQVGSGTPTTGNPGAGTAGGLVLGSAGAGGGQFGHCRVKEFMAFAAAHTAAQRALIIAYLNTL